MTLSVFLGQHLQLNQPCPAHTCLSKAPSLFRIRKNARRALSTPLSDTLWYPSFVCWANGARDDHLATCRRDLSKFSKFPGKYFFSIFFSLSKSSDQPSSGNVPHVCGPFSYLVRASLVRGATTSHSFFFGSFTKKVVTRGISQRANTRVQRALFHALSVADEHACPQRIRDAFVARIKRPHAPLCRQRGAQSRCRPSA